MYSNTYRLVILSAGIAMRFEIENLLNTNFQAELVYGHVNCNQLSQAECVIKRVGSPTIYEGLLRWLARSAGSLEANFRHLLPNSNLMGECCWVVLLPGFPFYCKSPKLLSLLLELLPPISVNGHHGLALVWDKKNSNAFKPGELSIMPNATLSLTFHCLKAWMHLWPFRPGRGAGCSYLEARKKASNCTAAGLCVPCLWPWCSGWLFLCQARQANFCVTFSHESAHVANSVTYQFDICAHQCKFCVTKLRV